MKKISLLSLVMMLFLTAQSQKVDSIYFHLYTDSLKKGTHNYINVDGKMSDGSWKPLSSKEVEFITSYGEFIGNDLVLPDSPTVKFVKIKARLRSDTTLCRDVIIYIKVKPDDEYLPSNEDVFRDMEIKRKRKRG